MQDIIAPVDINLIKAELTEERKLRDTNKGGNVLYVVNAFNAPNTMREIGRLREEAFRASGACSGLDCDIDEFDTMEEPYQQLLVWDPEAEAILGGYRYILGPDVKMDANGQPHLATAHMFHFSEKFITEYLPHTVELGRSFVSLNYQSSKAGAKALFSMDNLWDGLGAIMMAHSQIMYFFGKMTIHPSYDPLARDMIYHFLYKHFPDSEGLVTAYNPQKFEIDRRIFDVILNEDGFKDDYKLLKAAVMKLGTFIPPLVNSYMNTSPTMLMLGHALNDEFGDASESAILVCFNDMYDDKRARHVDSYRRWMAAQYHKRFPNLLPGFEDKLKTRWDEHKDKPRKRFLERLRRSEKKSSAAAEEALRVETKEPGSVNEPRCAEKEK